VRFLSSVRLLLLSIHQEFFVSATHISCYQNFGHETLHHASSSEEQLLILASFTFRTGTHCPPKPETSACKVRCTDLLALLLLSRCLLSQGQVDTFLAVSVRVVDHLGSILTVPRSYSFPLAFFVVAFFFWPAHSSHHSPICRLTRSSPNAFLSHYH